MEYTVNCLQVSLKGQILLQVIVPVVKKVRWKLRTSKESKFSTYTPAALMLFLLFIPHEYANGSKACLWASRWEREMLEKSYFCHDYNYLKDNAST